MNFASDDGIWLKRAAKHERRKTDSNIDNTQGKPI